MGSTETFDGGGSPVRTPSAGGIAASAPSERRGHDLATVGRSLDCAKAGVQSAALIAATARTLRGLGWPVTPVDSTTNVEQMTYRRRCGLPVLFEFTNRPSVTRSSSGALPTAPSLGTLAALPAGVPTVAFSPDGQHLASGGDVNFGGVLPQRHTGGLLCVRRVSVDVGGTLA